MHPRPLIYVSRISNLSDARYCAGMGADLLGYAVDPTSADYVSPADFQSLIGWVSGPRRVAEIGNPATIDLTAVVNHYAPDLLHVQFNHLSSLSTTLPLIVEVAFQDVAKATAALGKHKVEFLLVTGMTATGHISFLSSPPVLVAIDKPIDSVVDYLEKIKARGVALKGSHEQSPGLKDYDQLSAVLEELSE